MANELRCLRPAVVGASCGADVDRMFHNGFGNVVSKPKTINAERSNPLFPRGFGGRYRIVRAQ